jgi:hypothetical protein
VDTVQQEGNIMLLPQEMQELVVLVVVTGALAFVIWWIFNAGKN